MFQCTTGLCVPLHQENLRLEGKIIYQQQSCGAETYDMMFIRQCHNNIIYSQEPAPALIGEIFIFLHIGEFLSTECLCNANYDLLTN